MNTRSNEINKKYKKLVELLETHKPKSVNEISKIPGLESSGVGIGGDKQHAYACYFRYLFRRTHYAMNIMSKHYKTLKIDTNSGSGSDSGPSTSGISKNSIWVVKQDKQDKQSQSQSQSQSDNELEVYNTLLSMNIKLDPKLKEHTICLPT